MTWKSSKGRNTVVFQCVNVLIDFWILYKTWFLSMQTKDRVHKSSAQRLLLVFFLPTNQEVIYTWEARWLLLTPINWEGGKPAVVLSVECRGGEWSSLSCLFFSSENQIFPGFMSMTSSDKLRDFVFSHSLRKVSKLYRCCCMSSTYLVNCSLSSTDAFSVLVCLKLPPADCRGINPKMRTFSHWKQSHTLHSALEMMGIMLSALF